MSVSGPHPIGDPAPPADAVRTMTTAFKDQQKTETTGRRFEREGVADVSHASFGYQVDPDAVAEAIVGRLVAGGIWHLPPG